MSRAELEPKSSLIPKTVFTMLPSPAARAYADRVLLASRKEKRRSTKLERVFAALPFLLFSSFLGIQLYKVWANQPLQSLLCWMDCKSVPSRKSRLTDLLDSLILGTVRFGLSVLKAID